MHSYYTLTSIKVQRDTFACVQRKYFVSLDTEADYVTEMKFDREQGQDPSWQSRLFLETTSATLKQTLLGGGGCPADRFQFQSFSGGITHCLLPVKGQFVLSKYESNLQIAFVRGISTVQK